MYLVLNYEQSGNFTKFQNCIERCNFKSEDEYFNYNLLQALNISAAINLSWEDSGVRWAYNIDQSPIEIPKQICTLENLLNTGSELFTLIETGTGVPICLGLNPKNNSELWGKSYFDKFIDFPRLVDLSVRNIGIQRAVSKLDGYYSFDTFQWISSSNFPEHSCFFRVSGDYTGFSYYYYDEASSLYFKIKENETAYIACSFLLNLDFKKIIKFEKNDVVVHSSYRLPTFISRYLFANSSQLIIDSVLRFKNVNVCAYDTLMSYLVV